MKRPRFLIIIIGILLPTIMFAQVLSVKEISGTADSREIRNNSAVVDINSRLEINLELKNLKEKNAIKEKLVDTLFLNELNLYNQILSFQSKLLSYYMSNDSNLALSFLKDYTSLKKLLTYYPGVKEKFEKDYDDAYYKGENAYQKAITKLSVNILSGSSKLSSTANRKIAVRAYFKSKGLSSIPIHVKNYDNISENKFLEINATVKIPSVSEEKFLRSITEQDAKISAQLDSILKRLKEQVDIEKLLESTSDPALKTLPEPSNKIKQNLVEAIKELNTELEKPVNTNTGDNLKAISSKVVAITEELNISTSNLKKTTSENTVLKNLRNRAQIALDMISDNVDTIIIPVEKLITKAEGIVDEYRNYNVYDAPTKAYIDLKTIGKRQNFDEVHIEMVVIDEKKADTKEDDIVQTIELISLSLVQVKVHTQTNIGAIFANPFTPNKKVALDRNFQLALNSNFVFKWGSRTNHFVNFFQPGIGISISTPDFDLNTSPDLSFGLVGTAFKDVISLGLSYNTAVDAPFWFIGFSLPFAGIALPMGKVENNFQE